MVAAMPLAQQEKDAYQFYRPSAYVFLLISSREPWFWTFLEAQS